jgi:hypothetical protein
MKKAIGGVICFLLVSAVSAAGAQTASQKATSTPEALAKPALVLAAEKVFIALKQLNDRKELVPPPFGPGIYEGLKQENCFGLLLPNGLRLMGESSGTDYERIMDWADAQWI